MAGRASEPKVMIGTVVRLVGSSVPACGMAAVPIPRAAFDDFEPALSAWRLSLAWAEWVMSLTVGAALGQ